MIQAASLDKRLKFGSFVVVKMMYTWAYGGYYNGFEERGTHASDAEAGRAGAVPHLTRSGSTPRLSGVVCWFCRYCLTRSGSTPRLTSVVCGFCSH
jgi:hypothetical protein